jgi:fatty-acyl-CoA synthase
MPESFPWHRHWPRGLPQRIHVPQTTLSQNLDTAALRFPERAAIVFCDSLLSYAALKAQSDAALAA